MQTFIYTVSKKGKLTATHRSMKMDCDFIYFFLSIFSILNQLCNRNVIAGGLLVDTDLIVCGLTFFDDLRTLMLLFAGGP